MYGYPTPHYVLLVLGLFIGITSGLAFQETLKQLVYHWSRQTENQGYLPDILNRTNLRLPFLGILIGVCLFLSSGVEVFGFGTLTAYEFSMPLTLLTGLLVWNQLEKILNLLQKGGSKALDLDEVF